MLIRVEVFRWPKQKIILASKEPLLLIKKIYFFYQETYNLLTEKG